MMNIRECKSLSEVSKGQDGGFFIDAEHPTDPKVYMKCGDMAHVLTQTILEKNLMTESDWEAWIKTGVLVMPIIGTSQ